MNREAITLIRSKALTDAAPYASAAVAPPGAGLIFTAGACSLDEAGETETEPICSLPGTSSVAISLTTMLRARCSA